eukprot:5470619-Amphidinium_carterae.2
MSLRQGSSNVVLDTMLSPSLQAVRNERCLCKTSCPPKVLRRTHVTLPCEAQHLEHARVGKHTRASLVKCLPTNSCSPTSHKSKQV